MDNPHTLNVNSFAMGAIGFKSVLKNYVSLLVIAFYLVLGHVYTVATRHAISTEGFGLCPEKRRGRHFKYSR